MSSQNAPTPLPQFDFDNKDYWAWAKKRELRIQRCTKCRTFRFPPRPVCHACHSFDFKWYKCSGKGAVYSYTIVTHPTHPAFRDKVPYGVVLVELEEGVRMISNVVDVPPDQLRIGMPVEVVFEDVAEDVTLPKFRKTKP